MWQRIKNKGKSFYTEFLLRNNLASKSYINSFPNTILMYHGIDRIGRNVFNSRHTGKDDFEIQLKFLQKNFNVISVSDFFQGKFSNNRPNIALTFDDGYLNNFTNALPLLEKYKTPASIYITGIQTTENPYLWADFLNIASIYVKKNIEIEGEIFENINGMFISRSSNLSLFEVVKNRKADYNYKLSIYKAFKSEFKLESLKDADEYWKLVSVNEIKSLSKSNYVTIGSHGFYHNNLGKLKPDSVEFELLESKKYLENIIQKEVLELAYPDGSYSTESLNIADTIGYKYQLATEVYNFESEKNDRRILTRRGLYACDYALMQLITAF